MSEGWSKLLDVGPLADGRAEIDFSIPLRHLPRVLPMLAAPDGEAVGRVAFSREGRIAVAATRVAAEVTLTCQRCLGPLVRRIEGSGRAALVATAAEAERVPDTVETVLAPDYRISLRDLVEEELLLALPLVPRHEDKDCAGDSAGAGQGFAEEPPAETQRPFGQLGELLKRQ
ncbi:MAG TPA: YceD family protein [Steroidobacteraceae bacterium]|nr:YceD family protein [Steroidobacteraceae bacterium]